MLLLVCVWYIFDTKSLYLTDSYKVYALATCVPVLLIYPTLSQSESNPFIALIKGSYPVLTTQCV